MKRNDINIDYIVMFLIFALLVLTFSIQSPKKHKFTKPIDVVVRKIITESTKSVQPVKLTTGSISMEYHIACMQESNSKLRYYISSLSAIQQRLKNNKKELETITKKVITLQKRLIRQAK